MKKEEKTIAVYGAIAANLFIAVMKFVVSFITGSSAMLAEAIHSAADTDNEFLLLLGIKRSKKPPEEKHPLGYGRELYFWSLIVAIVLFGAGAGMSIYEGVTNLSQPGEMKNVGWKYAVLGFAFLADGTSWTIAFRQLWKQKREDESFWQSIRTSKDPSIFIVFGEDTADVAGYLLLLWDSVGSGSTHGELPAHKGFCFARIRASFQHALNLLLDEGLYLRCLEFGRWHTLHGVFHLEFCVCPGKKAHKEIQMFRRDFGESARLSPTKRRGTYVVLI